MTPGQKVLHYRVHYFEQATNLTTDKYLRYFDISLFKKGIGTYKNNDFVKMFKLFFYM